MKAAAVVLSALTILSLDLILLLGAVVRDPGSIRSFLNGLVVVLDTALVTSSALLGVLFTRRGSKLLGAVFFLNIGITAAAFVLRIQGYVFPSWVLFLADIYWLNLYLICLTKNFKTLLKLSS